MIKRVVFFLLFFVLSGCPLSYQIEIFGKMDSTSYIISTKKKYALSFNEKIVISDAGDEGISWKDLAWNGDNKKGYYPILTIICRDEERKYDLSQLYVYEGVGTQSGGKITYKIVLKENCDLYTVNGDMKMRTYSQEG